MICKYTHGLVVRLKVGNHSNLGSNPSIGPARPKGVLHKNLHFSDVINTSLSHHYYVTITSLLHHYHVIITSLLHHCYIIITHYYNFIIAYYYIIIASLLRHYYSLLPRHYYTLLLVITSLLFHYDIIMTSSVPYY